MKNQEVTKIDREGLKNGHLTADHIIRANLMKIVRTASLEDLKKAFDIEVFDPYSEESKYCVDNYSNTVTHSDSEVRRFARIQAARLNDRPEIEITTTLKV